MAEYDGVESDAKKYSFGTYWFRLILSVSALFAINGLITRQDWLYRLFNGGDPQMANGVPVDPRNWPACVVDSLMRGDTHKAYLVVLLVFLVLHLVFTNLFWGVLSSKPLRKMLHRQFMWLCVLGFFLEFISYTMKAWIFPPETHFANLMTDIPIFGWASHIAVPLEELFWIVMVVPLFHYLYLYLNWWSHDIHYVFDTKDRMISKTMKAALRPKITRIYLEVRALSGEVVEKERVIAERISRFPEAQLHWLAGRCEVFKESGSMKAVAAAGSTMSGALSGFFSGGFLKACWDAWIRNPGMAWETLCGSAWLFCAMFLFVWGYTGEAIDVGWIGAVLFFLLPAFLRHFPTRVIFFSIPLVSLPSLAVHMGAVSHGQYAYHSSTFYLGAFTEGRVCAETWAGLMLSGRTMPMMAIFFFLLLPVGMFSLFTGYLMAYNFWNDDRKDPAVDSRSRGPALRRRFFWVLCVGAPLFCLVLGIRNGFGFTSAMALPAGFLSAAAYRWSPLFRFFVGSNRLTVWLIVGGALILGRNLLQVFHGYGGYDPWHLFIHFPGYLVMALAFPAMLCFLAEWMKLESFKKLLLATTRQAEPGVTTKRKMPEKKSR